MGNWEAILVGLFVVVLLFWFRPGIKAALQQSRDAKEKDWQGVLFPIALVVLFVVFLMYAM